MPEFWSWLQHQGANGNIKIPLEIMEEVLLGRKDDPLIEWISKAENADALLLEESVDRALVQRVLRAYAPDLTDDEVEQIGRDPFLIAYALAAPFERCVVTTEISRPSAQRQNRKFPMCAGLWAFNSAGRSS